MKKQVTFFTLLFFLTLHAAFAQTDVPLKFTPQLPKNLYAAPTAVLINYATNRETTAEEDARKINEYSTQLLTDNQRLNLQLLHFADKNSLLNTTLKQRLLKQYDSLKIENLLFLDITDISGQGAQGSYVFTLTAYNHTPKLMTPKQKAVTMQAETFEKLIQRFAKLQNNAPAGYFIKGPARQPQKPALTTEPAATTTVTETKKTPAIAALKYPVISLTYEDLQRGNGGAHNNFYYYLGADQTERNAGFFGQHLRKEMAVSPGAVHELNKYRNYKIAFLAERTVFVSSVVLYANEILKKDTRSYFNDRQKAYLGIAAGSLLLNIFISRHTNQHMFRAFDEYNAFATMQNQTGFHFRKPDNWGLGSIYNRKVVPGITLQWNLR